MIPAYAIVNRACFLLMFIGFLQNIDDIPENVSTRTSKNNIKNTSHKFKIFQQNINLLGTLVHRFINNKTSDIMEWN